MMIMDKRNEIYELGKKVDLLQQLNCKTDNKQEILELIDSITVYFENNDGDNTDIDYNVVYFYTKANYLTVLIEVVKHKKSNYMKAIILYRMGQRMKCYMILLF